METSRRLLACLLACLVDAFLRATNLSRSVLLSARSRNEALFRVHACRLADLRPCVSRSCDVRRLLKAQLLVYRWTKEDHEIFDLVSALEASEGKGTTFYSFLGVAPQAQLKDINRQYRKRSLDLQYVPIRAFLFATAHLILLHKPGQEPKRQGHSRTLRSSGNNH